MVPLRDFHLKGRMRSLAAGLVLWLGLLLAAPAAEAQTGIFSIFRMPQQTDIAPQADAEEDAEFATPPLNALPAPALPLPPRRMTMVQNPTAPAPRPPGLEAVSPAPVLPLAASSPANAPAPVQSPVPQFTAPGVPAGPLLAVPDLPLPPRRPGAPAPAPEPEPQAQQAEAPAEPPPAVDFDSFAERPTMLASLPFPGCRPMGQPPLQQQETTTEELEKEEERTPEPMHVERQTDDVDIACLKPDLMVLVRKAGDRFGATPAAGSAPIIAGAWRRISTCRVFPAPISHATCAACRKRAAWAPIATPRACISISASPGTGRNAAFASASPNVAEAGPRRANSGGARKRTGLGLGLQPAP